MGRTRCVLVAASTVLAVACTGGEGGSDGGSAEFCAAYDAFVAAEAGGRVDELRRTVELAPSETGRYLELLLALEERAVELDVADFDGDVTGDLASMEVVMQLRAPAAVESAQRLQEVLVEDCGRADPADLDRPPVTPFTSISPLED